MKVLEGPSMQEQGIQTEVSLVRRVSVVWHCVAEGPQAIVDSKDGRTVLAVSHEGDDDDRADGDGGVETEESVSGDPRNTEEPTTISRNQESPGSLFDFDRLHSDEEDLSLDRFKGADRYEEDARTAAEQVF